MQWIGVIFILIGLIITNLDFKAIKRYFDKYRAKYIESKEEQF